MSLKAIKDLVYIARHGIATTGDRIAVVDAEIAALEKAAKTLTGTSSDIDGEIVQAVTVLEAIAKEAE